MNSNRCDCTIIIPTRNRVEVLSQTLTRLAALPDRYFETIVVDNGSTDTTAALQRHFSAVRWIELGENLGCAARNVAAAAARGSILFMLDDDSWPEPGTIDAAVRLFDEELDLGAAACRVRLADRPATHDAGGIPGMFFNCGGIIRRMAFMEVGGFPIDYEYYVEEYDLACKLWRREWRVAAYGDLQVWHARVAENRDNNRMLRLLVRNNLRLWHRYAPAALRQEMSESTIERYRRVAEKENAMAGFEAGLQEASDLLRKNPMRFASLSRRQFDLMFGLDVAQERMKTWADNHAITSVAVWGRGKGCEQIISLCNWLNIRIEAVYDRRCSFENDWQWRGVALRDQADFDETDVDGIVVGSLSPGVAEDTETHLSMRFPSMSVLSPVEWNDSKRAKLATA